MTSDQPLRDELDEYRNDRLYKCDECGTWSEYDGCCCWHEWEMCDEQFVTIEAARLWRELEGK